ncbi:MAG: hypothetical protein QNK33_01470 [Bacteroidales bacterium]|nr:hypothetical protein [Bacteroidales bacterium]
MKKLFGLLIIISAFMLLAPTAQAQESDYAPTMVIKTNPLAALGGPFWVVIIPLTGEYKALFEIKTLAKQSVTIGASFLGPSLLLNMDEITTEGEDISGINTAGFRAQLWYKFYIGRDKEAPEGFYLGPHISYATANLTSKDVTSDKLSMVKLNVNAVIGYQLITSGGFAFDVFTGLGLKNLGFTAEGDSGDILDFEMDDKFTPSVVLGINFGFAF